MRIENHYYMIIDVEATCCNEGSVPRDEMEIIEIGSVMLDACTYEVVSEFQSFIRPVRHPNLTEFCTDLTGITQTDVDDAPLLPQVLNKMKQWMKTFNDSLFCSWGDYDRRQFIQDCQYHGIQYPFRSDHLNLKKEFSRSLSQRKTFGIERALRYIGLDFVGSHHRGIDDARNIARIVRWVCSGA